MFGTSLEEAEDGENVNERESLQTLSRQPLASLSDRMSSLQAMRTDALGMDFEFGDTIGDTFGDGEDFDG